MRWYALQRQATPRNKTQRNWGNYVERNRIWDLRQSVRDRKSSFRAGAGTRFFGVRQPPKSVLLQTTASSRKQENNTAKGLQNG